MGYQEDRQTPCGYEGCNGSRATVYVYDDDGNCVSQHMFNCDVCGR